ncbi:hypothetical protein HII31_07258 [Pseudocercospora fuligena]|uniref:Uncharacterized protein n=1 Tax=Pseudocercospora fuligena TaxID=685502 RepID=A0A8H6RG47_9PEZI|nr:hypothetical protein HII31_07258 [Pseudocercospora fuligena]
MSIDAGGLAQMTYNNQNNGFQNGLGLPPASSGFGARSRLNNKRLSVALPPKVAPINENSIVDNPTPRTSRSHLLAGLRTQPKTPGAPASAPYHQTHHSMSGLGGSKWAEQTYNGYGQGLPQTASAASFDLPSQYASNAGRQMYSLPEQVLAPPSVYEQAEDVDPQVLQQMQLHSLYLAQRQQQLQQQLASITAATQNMSMNGRASFHQGQMTPLTTRNFYVQQQQPQQVQSPIEVPGQPGVYLVYNPATQGYTYAVDQNYQQQAQQIASPVQQAQMNAFSPTNVEPSANRFNNFTPPATERSTPTGGRSFTPPKKVPSPPSALDTVEPLPPPSANAFRRGQGHKKASSLSINAFSNIADGPKTSSAATFGSQRSVIPPTPMTGTFGPGAARAGEHPMRQPRGPPPFEELSAAPTSLHEGSKNFATRQRRRALDSLMKAGTVRRGVSRSSGGSPVSEAEYDFPAAKMSPIGSEMKEKRSSQGSADGYFGLSSASSSEGEDMGIYKNPPTPATPGSGGGDRKKMMLGVLNAAEKRRSHIV